MRKPIIPFIISVSLFLIACGNETNNQASTATAIDTIAAMTIDTASEKKYDVKILDNKKDPTCGMPVTAGVSDTAHYKNKLIGFCFIFNQRYGIVLKKERNRIGSPIGDPSRKTSYTRH